MPRPAVGDRVEIRDDRRWWSGMIRRRCGATPARHQGQYRITFVDDDEWDDRYWVLPPSEEGETWRRLSAGSGGREPPQSVREPREAGAVGKDAGSVCAPDTPRVVRGVAVVGDRVQVLEDGTWSTGTVRSTRAGGYRVAFPWGMRNCRLSPSEEGETWRRAAVSEAGDACDAAARTTAGGGSTTPPGEAQEDAKRARARAHALRMRRAAEADTWRYYGERGTWWRRGRDGLSGGWSVNSKLTLTTLHRHRPREVKLPGTLSPSALVALRQSVNGL